MNSNKCTTRCLESYQDLAKDTMIMQDRAKRTMFYNDLGYDAKINHVLDKHFMVAIAFFWKFCTYSSTFKPSSSLKSIFSLSSMIARAVFWQFCTQALAMYLEISLRSKTIPCTVNQTRNHCHC